MEDRVPQTHLLRRKGVVIPALILLALIGWRLAGKVADQSAQNAQRSAQGRSAPNVSVAPVEIRDIVQTFDATGNMEAPLNVKIAPKITGRIEYLQVREGDKVRKGDVLVRIDTSQVEADVRQQQAAVAEAQYRLAQAKLTQGSNDTGITSQIRQQKAAADTAVADYEQTQQNYSAQVASAQANITDSDGKIANAEAAIANAQASINAAQANLENARAKNNRTTDLYNKGFVSTQAMEDAQAALKVAEASVESAKGLLLSANALRDSAVAQKRVAVQQAKIVTTKGAADIKSAQARVVQANAAVDYAQSNISQKAAYKQSISALSSAVDAAKAGLRSAQARRADTVLISPLDGFVTARYVDPGAVVTAGQPAISVQFMKQIWVSVAVPEEIVAKLHIGQSAKVTPDAFPDSRFAGSIIQINPSADPQSRQFTIRVILDNSRSLLKPGMFAHVMLDTERVRGTMAVPREAVQHDDNGDYVVVAGADGKAKQQRVITGESDAEYISIRQGLSTNDKVVTMSAFPLRDGQPIRTGGGPKNGGPKGGGYK